MALGRQRAPESASERQTLPFARRAAYPLPVPSSTCCHHTVGHRSRRPISCRRCHPSSPSRRQAVTLSRCPPLRTPVALAFPGRLSLPSPSPSPSAVGRGTIKIDVRQWGPPDPPSAHSAPLLSSLCSPTRANTTAAATPRARRHTSCNQAILTSAPSAHALPTRPVSYRVLRIRSSAGRRPDAAPPSPQRDHVVPAPLLARRILPQTNLTHTPGVALAPRCCHPSA
jgi:hypothetical protein